MAEEYIYGRENFNRKRIKKQEVGLVSVASETYFELRYCSKRYVFGPKNCFHFAEGSCEIRAFESLKTGWNE